ncbi:HIT domain-containing protein [Candidatus Daviesbacteria bacterium]|nr:HIT domain-containing protein [Candidatus Daviesbacteria bacterium]
MGSCIFCKIIKKEIPTNFVYESDKVVAFPDINPSAAIHLLIVPKEHIRGMGEIDEGHSQILTEVFEVAKRLVDANHLEQDLYRLVVNGGSAQHLPHLHFHFLGGHWKKMV